MEEQKEKVGAVEADGEGGNRKRTRKGEQYLHPKEVTLHATDFEFGEVSTDGAKRKLEDALHHCPVLTDSDSLQQHLAQQPVQWEKHYEQNKAQFFPVKNYICHAFPSLLGLLEETHNANVNSPVGDGGGGAQKAEGGHDSAPPAHKQRRESATDGGSDGCSVEEQTATSSGSSSERGKGKGDDVVVMECGCGNGSVVLPLMKFFGPQQQGSSSHGGDVVSKSSTTEQNEPQKSCGDDDDDEKCGAAAGGSQTEESLDIRRTAGRVIRYVCFDISPTAVTLLQNHPFSKAFVEQEGGELVAFPHDITVEEEIPYEPQGTVDRLLLVFVLCALPVGRMVHALSKLRRMLKPHAKGELLFRDYAAYDHNQTRYANNGNTVTADGSFVKGDGTQQFFFEMEFTRRLFDEAGLRAKSLEYHCNRVKNRANGKTMDKVFINGVFVRKE